MGAFGRTVTANAWLTGLESARQSIILQVVTPRNAYQDHLTPFSSKGMANIQIGKIEQVLRVGYESDPVLRGADITQCRKRSTPRTETASCSGTTTSTVGATCLSLLYVTLRVWTPRIKAK
jgi:hypothetical protein